MKAKTRAKPSQGLGAKGTTQRGSGAAGTTQRPVTRSQETSSLEQATSALQEQQSAGTQGPQHSSTIERTRPSAHSGGRTGQVTLPVHEVRPPSQLSAGSVDPQYPGQPTVHLSVRISKQTWSSLQPLPSLLTQSSGSVSTSPADPPEPPTAALAPPEPPALEESLTVAAVASPTEPLVPPTEPAELLVLPTEPPGPLLESLLVAPAPDDPEAPSLEWCSVRPAQARTTKPTVAAAKRAHTTES